MIIDSRDSGIRETCLRLKELFAFAGDNDVEMTVLTVSVSDARQIMGFASMSGFRTEMKRQDGHCCISITGTSCRCFR